MDKRPNASAVRNITIGLLVVAAAFTLGVRTTPGQTGVVMPRTADGKPDFNGIWEAMNTANWDIQDHAARQGPVVALGAAYSVPAGQSVVEGNEIPYKPEALAKKKENAQKWMSRDPEVKCFMPGVPRANYMPYPFQIVQTPTQVLMAYEFATAARTIYMNSKAEAPVDSWMGWSRGSWDGDTLVVDVTGMMPDTWFDRAGNYHSDALHVVERYTPLTRDAISYEATIDDPNVFTRPWKMKMPLYRRLDKNAQLLEYKCVEFAEEAMYGYLRKPTRK
jgi:hypothetical protein